MPRRQFAQFVAPPAQYVSSESILISITGLTRGDNDSANNGDRRDDRSVEHPLIILSSGFPYSIAFNQPVGGIAVGRQIRKAITYFVAQGFDVLFFDKRGHGYSEGLLDGMGEDIFRALDQLERGAILSFS